MTTTIQRTGTSPFPAGRPEVGRNHNSLPRTITPCDGCPKPAVGLVTCDARLSVGGGSFRSFRCDHCAAKVIAQFDGIGLTAKLERFGGSAR